MDNLKPKKAKLLASYGAKIKSGWENLLLGHCDKTPVEGGKKSKIPDKVIYSSFVPLLT